MNSNRRSFLKKSALAAAVIPFVSLRKFWLTENTSFAADMHASEQDAVAKAIGYHTDASKVDVKKFTKRAGAEGKKQFCNNCSFYTTKNADWGKCTLIQNGDVAAKGWCNSWNKKA